MPNQFSRYSMPRKHGSFGSNIQVSIHIERVSGNGPLSGSVQEVMLNERVTTLASATLTQTGSSTLSVSGSSANVVDQSVNSWAVSGVVVASGYLFTMNFTLNDFFDSIRIAATTSGKLRLTVVADTTTVFSGLATPPSAWVDSYPGALTRIS